MQYKLTEMPEKVYWAETKQFTVKTENGEEFDIRIGENSKFSEYWIYKNGWEEIEDAELMEYIYEGLPNDEYEFEEAARKEREEKMDKIFDEYVKEKGDDINIDDFVSKLAREILYPRDITHYEEFYHNYHYAKNKIKKWKLEN